MSDVLKVVPLVVPKIRETDAFVDTATGRVIVTDARVAPPPSWMDGAQVVGIAELVTSNGLTRRAIVVQRSRPFIPCGQDPRQVNQECARRFALVEQIAGGGFDVIEVTT